MTPEEYIKGVLKTESVDLSEIFTRLEDHNIIRILHAATGLSTESGEFLDTLKKYIFYGKELDLINIKEELGDCLWYIGVALDVLGCDFEEIMEQNINKLRSRYEGKFTKEKAINRDLGKEREVLEDKIESEN